MLQARPVSIRGGWPCQAGGADLSSAASTPPPPALPSPGSPAKPAPAPALSVAKPAEPPPVETGGLAPLTFPSLPPPRCRPGQIDGNCGLEAQGQEREGATGTTPHIWGQFSGQKLRAGLATTGRLATVDQDENEDRGQNAQDDQSGQDALEIDAYQDVPLKLPIPPGGSSGEEDVPLKMPIPPGGSSGEETVPLKMPIPPGSSAGEGWGLHRVYNEYCIHLLTQPKQEENQEVEKQAPVPNPTPTPTPVPATASAPAPPTASDDNLVPVPFDNVLDVSLAEVGRVARDRTVRKK